MERGEQGAARKPCAPEEGGAPQKHQYFTVGEVHVKAALTGCPGMQRVSGSLVYEQRGKVMSKCK